jgi:hypothetical protein
MKLDLVTKSFVVLVLCFVAACAVPGSYVNSSVNGVQQTYRYDEGGKKVLVYETDRTGKLIVHDPSDKRARQMMSWQKGQQKAEAEDAARLEKIKQAPKRKPTDPIFVNIKSIDYVGDKLKLTEKDKQPIHDSIRKPFENDPIIRLLPEEQSDQAGGRPNVRSAFNELGREVGGEKTNADVDIVVKVSYSMGIGGKKGKLVEVQEVDYLAIITGRQMRNKHEAKGGSTMLDIPGNTKRFVDRVKKVIVNDVGPTIPADRSL